MTTTTNLGLTTYSESSGSLTTFLTYRLAQSGLSSNMTILDNFAGETSASIVSLEANALVNVDASYISPNYYEATTGAVSSYATNMMINLQLNTSITGSTTLNINALGSKTLKKINVEGAKENLESGDLRANRYYLFIYDATDFILIGSSLADQISIPGTVDNFVSISASKVLVDSTVPVLTGVASGSYTRVDVDSYGRVTSGSTGEQSSNISGSSVMSDTTGSEVRHNESGVGAGSYNHVDVDVFGHATSASLIALIYADGTIDYTGNQSWDDNDITNVGNLTIGGASGSANLNVFGSTMLGNGNFKQAKYNESGDLYSEGGVAYFGEGFVGRTRKYGLGLRINAVADPASSFYDIDAIFSASALAFEKAGETFVSDGVVAGDFLTITDASDSSYIGASCEISHVAETILQVNFGSSGSNALDDLTGVDFAVVQSPILGVLDNGVIHTTIGKGDEARFHVHIPEGNSANGMYYEIIANKDGYNAIELDIDADNLSGVSAMRVNYDATAFDSTVDVGTIHDIVIDNVGATNGDIHAIDVAVADTAGSVLNVEALATHEGVAPIAQYTGSSASLVSAWEYSGSFVDVTTAFNSSGCNIQIFDNDDDYILLAAPGKWDEINVILDTPSSHTIIPTFEYIESSGSWVAFTPSDDSNGFSQNGTIRFNQNALTTWGVRTINEVTGKTGADDYYWIRITRTRGVLPTSPTESTIQITALATKLGWDKVGVIKANTLAVIDGITAPDTVSGFAQIYVDVADGDLKVKFGDGHVAVLAADS